MHRRNFLSLTGIVGAGFTLSPLPLLASRAAEQPFSFDPYFIPFSCAGAYLTISKKENTATSGLVINTVRRSAIPYKWQQTWSHNLLDIVLRRDGVAVPYTTVATPLQLALSGGGVSATIRFADADTLVCDTKNCDLQLQGYRAFAWTYRTGARSICVFDNQPDHHYHIAAPQGTVQATTDALTGTQTTWLHITKAEQLDWQPPATLPTQLSQTFTKWMQQVPRSLPAHRAAVQTGWFLCWNLQVAPAGNYTRQSILSSKRSMSMLWSWDICFNALAIAAADHRLAWDQLFAILDHQLPNGLLPDTVSDLNSVYGFNKPPVWGWTVTKLLAQTPVKERLHYTALVYPKIVALTQWWLTHRNLGKQGVCAYMHGNDSGWDNASLFDEKLPAATPDLTTWLILQLEALAQMAHALQKPADAAQWTSQAAHQLFLFKSTFISVGGGLHYRVLTEQGPATRSGDCLLLFVPLLLGNRLPPATRQAMIAKLAQEGYLLTPHGLASEAVNSPHYEANGYWRGPVWGPSNYIIVDGLLACGAHDLAFTVAQRFCDTVAADGNFRENYDALTGEGYYDSGMTWMAADFLLLAGLLAD